MAVQADGGSKAEQIARFKECYGDLSLIDNYKSLRWVLDRVPYLPAAVSAYLPVTSRMTRR